MSLFGLIALAFGWSAALWLLATGASLTAVMVILTVAVLESKVPSLTLKVNESLPVAFVFGV